MSSSLHSVTPLLVSPPRVKLKPAPLLQRRAEEDVSIEKVVYWLKTNVLCRPTGFLMHLQKLPGVYIDNGGSYLLWREHLLLSPYTRNYEGHISTSLSLSAPPPGSPSLVNKYCFSVMACITDGSTGEQCKLEAEISPLLWGMEPSRDDVLDCLKALVKTYEHTAEVDTGGREDSQLESK